MIVTLVFSLIDIINVVQYVGKWNVSFRTDAQYGPAILQITAVIREWEGDRPVHAHQSAELGLVVPHLYPPRAQFDDGVRAAHTDVWDAHVRLTAPPDRHFLVVLVEDQDMECTCKIIFFV